MKRYRKLLMIWMMVLIGAALFMSSDASAVIVGTAPAATVGTFVRPVGLPLGLAPRPPLGLPPGLVRPPIGLVRPSIFNPFLIRPIFNPFLIRPIFNPFLDVDDLGIGLGLGLNPGLGEVD